jgi:hypothetical protein
MAKMVFEDRPFLGMVDKRYDFGGTNGKLPVHHTDPQGSSNTFANARTVGRASSVGVSNFTVEEMLYYGEIAISNLAAAKSENGSNAFASALETSLDGMINNVSNDIEFDMYRSRWGTRGRIRAGTLVTGATIQLTNPTDAWNFFIGMKVVCAASETSAIRTASTNVASVAGIDPVAGTVTFSAAADDATNGLSTAVAAGDYLFRLGCHVSTTPLCVAGVTSWCPETAPTVGGGDSFLGLDRGGNPMLYGAYVDYTGNPLEEAVQDALAETHMRRGKTDTILMHTKKFTQLCKEIGARRTDVGKSADGRVGYSGVTVVGPSGEVKVVPSANCQYDRMHVLNMKEWHLWVVGSLVPLFKKDGTPILRVDDDDSVYARSNTYLQLVCEAPGHQLVAAI